MNRFHHKVTLQCFLLPQVSSTSEDGRGVLTIRNAIPEDAGAYTCEALNNKGSIFAQPDTIVTINCK